MTTTTGGVKLTTTYAAYISKTQPADTYSGQAIYTLVHPSNHGAPIANPAVLDTGKVVNSKLKSLAATVVSGEEKTITPEFNYSDYDYNWDYEYGWGYDSLIKTISVHLNTTTPTDFIPSEKNTISSTTSKKPIYIIFDNTNNAGIMHFYTEGEKIFLPADSSFMFYYFFSLSEISGISDWDTSNATDMSNMFASAGRSATAWSIGDLSSWNTSSVTNMSNMFTSAGSSATTFTLNLSSWNTSNVTSMDSMFYNAGYSATIFTLDLSSWNTSSVTNMGSMFYNAGKSATTWSVTIPQTNGNSINNTTSRLYGQTTSKYADSPSGKSFTIAQP